MANSIDPQIDCYDKNESKKYSIETRKTIKVKRKMQRDTSADKNKSPSITDVKIDQTKNAILGKPQTESSPHQIEKVEWKSQSSKENDTSMKLEEISEFSAVSKSDPPSEEAPLSDEDDIDELVQLNKPKPLSKQTVYEKEIDKLREKLVTTTPFEEREEVE